MWHNYNDVVYVFSIFFFLYCFSSHKKNRLGLSKNTTHKHNKYLYECQSTLYKSFIFVQISCMFDMSFLFNVPFVLQTIFKHCVSSGMFVIRILFCFLFSCSIILPFVVETYFFSHPDERRPPLPLSPSLPPPSISYS